MGLAAQKENKLLQGIVEEIRNDGRGKPCDVIVGVHFVDSYFVAVDQLGNSILKATYGVEFDSALKEVFS